MEIIREKEYYGLTKGHESDNIGMAVLENGAWILHHPDGSATGSDGRMYYNVSKEILSEHQPDYTIQIICNYAPENIMEAYPETDLIHLGWTLDADAPVVLPMEE